MPPLGELPAGHSRRQGRRSSHTRRLRGGGQGGRRRRRRDKIGGLERGGGGQEGHETGPRIGVRVRVRARGRRIRDGSVGVHVSSRGVWGEWEVVVERWSSGGLRRVGEGAKGRGRGRGHRV